ncbi:unnamed protein product [Rotaria socialis]|uniref:NACHT domain-containing protein n=1 Tax=Rotaria socialis TaxID=392032 RepID=A0A818NNL8_9BILA|nr:unnamed protein product [Rotaria socialis]CAF4276463.1 unnamed protein product [Rotaria socialis]
MNEIEHAVNSIHKILKTPPEHLLTDCGRSQLIDIFNTLIPFINSNSPRKEWARLICRQLNRFTNYNHSILNKIWVQYHDDILYLQEETNGEQGMGRGWNHFKRIINFEKELERRESQFYLEINEQKSLNQLFCEHQKFFEKYLLACISLHSKVKVHGLIENINDALCTIYELKESSINSESLQCLNKKLKCIEIDFDCTNRKFQNLTSQFSKNDNSHKGPNSNFSTFLPSVEQIKINRSDTVEHITNILLCNRWTIVLGDPGSGKTSLLRWITCVFAESILNAQERIVLEGDDSIPVRVPILIRIGEFAMWFKKYPTKTLIDYVGEHTWDSKRYCPDDNKNVLKELIAHGHALILLDGLDEITDARQKGEIVDLVRKFVDKYVRGPDFISAFDDRMFHGTLLSLSHGYRNIVETKPPSVPGGNQLIITSRIVGYQLHPLVGTFICHYAFLLMDYNETKEFVKRWLSQIDKAVLEISLDEGINLDRELVEILSKKRYNVLKALLKNSSDLVSNPSLLSLICTFTFQSLDKFNPTSRVEVYNHAVQIALHSWKSHESKISQRVLTKFLIDLACYLHFHSPSGLIDEYDIKQLCCLTLQQQGLSCDRTKLRKYVRNLIPLLDFNIGIFAERGLQVFGFVHLSFQDYFVALSLVHGSPDEVAKRILTVAIHPRFHESLLLAIGWISWRWSSNNYDRFCNLLITSSTQYSIPFGTILFFEAFNDIQRLPSSSLIFIALNILLDHPYYPSKTTYLMSVLLKLHENIIIEWMETQLKDEKRLSNFCRCLLQNAAAHKDEIETKQKSMPSAVYQQLWLLHNISESAELIIDQTLRIIMRSTRMSDQIFNEDLSLYLLSNNISISDSHPLIISAIIGVCDGVCFREEKGIIKIDFSIQQIHHQSSILTPIIEYFANINESHSMKIDKLIQKYESIIEKCLPSDSSSNVVDSFIVLICLQGLLQPLIYQKHDRHKALSVALGRLKRTWFYIKKSFNSCLSGNDKLHSISFIQSEVQSIIDESLLRLDQSDEQRTSFLMACASALEKLGMWNHSVWINRDDCYGNEDGKHFHHQSGFENLFSEENLDEMKISIHTQEMTHQKLMLLLNILPQSLQQLYYDAIISSTNNTNSFSIVVFLSECLIHLEHFKNVDFNIYLALLLLYPLLKEHMLENYALIFYKEKCSLLTSTVDKNCNQLLKAIHSRKLLDPFLNCQPEDLKSLISVEHQRIREATQSIRSQQKDLRLFAASISLARLLQAQHRCRPSHPINTNLIKSTESKTVYSTITNIFDPFLRIFALSCVLDMNDPLIFDENQRDRLQDELTAELQSLLPHVSLLKGTILLLRCRNLCSQQMTSTIAEKFSNESLNKQSRIEEAVFVALRQFKDSNLSHCLSDFAKRKDNLVDLLQLKSAIFYRYFNKTTSFGSSNNILLSLMYLFELIFDTEILSMYARDDKKNDILPLKELNKIWNESSKAKKTMTYNLAIWITNNLEMIDKQILLQITQDMCECLTIERKALAVIEKWLDYRADKVLKVLAHYAALQLFIEESTIPDLIDIINEMFCIRDKRSLESIVENLINSRLANSNTVRQILIMLHENVNCYSKISVKIACKETFALFLDLERKRVTSNVLRSSKISLNSFLSMASGCSYDLAPNLVENFRLYLNFRSELENSIKDEYFAVVIKWMYKNLTSYYNDEFFIELYKYMLAIIDVKRFPLICKVIVNALIRKYHNFAGKCESIVFQDDIIIELEKLIYSSYKYSDDLLAVCLVAYGNCLIQLHEFEMSRTVSDEMKNILTSISERSSSAVSSIRATLCLFFIDSSDINGLTILKWYRNKSNITSEKRYQILLQQTLYTMQKSSHNVITDEIIDNLKAHSTELIDLFVVDLYNYLCNRDKLDYVSDSTPNYIFLAAEIIESNLNEFRDAIQRSFFGEEKFKRELYLSCKKYPHSSESFIKFYADFGILTIDLVEMCEEYADDCFFGIEAGPNLSSIKEVDRGLIDQLFQVLDLKLYDRKFKCSLWILKYLAGNHMISLLEVHQRIPLIDNILDHVENQLWKSEKYVFDLLLNTSCFSHRVSSDFKEIFFTKSDIDEEFEKVTDFIDKKLLLFVRKNNF